MGTIKNWIRHKKFRYYRPPQVIPLNDHDIKLHYPIKQYIETTVSKLPIDFIRYISCAPVIYVNYDASYYTIVSKYTVIIITPKICKFYLNSTAVCYNILRQNLDRYHSALIRKIVSITTKLG